MSNWQFWTITVLLGLSTFGVFVILRDVIKCFAYCLKLIAACGKDAALYVDGYRLLADQ